MVAAQVLIRAMSAADVPAVRALDALVQPSPWSEEFLREQLVDTASRTLLVAEGPDGSQVGHAALPRQPQTRNASCRVAAAYPRGA